MVKSRGKKFSEWQHKTIPHAPIEIRVDKEGIFSAEFETYSMSNQVLEHLEKGIKQAVEEFYSLQWHSIIIVYFSPTKPAVSTEKTSELDVREEYRRQIKMYFNFTRHWVAKSQKGWLEARNWDSYFNGENYFDNPNSRPDQPYNHSGFYVSGLDLDLDKIPYSTELRTDFSDYSLGAVFYYTPDMWQRLIDLRESFVTLINRVQAMLFILEKDEKPILGQFFNAEFLLPALVQMEEEDDNDV